MNGSSFEDAWQRYLEHDWFRSILFSRTRGCKCHKPHM